MLEMLLAIPALPFVAFLIQIFVGKKLPRQGDWVSTLAIFISFILALINFVQVIGNNDPNTLYVWGLNWIPLEEVAGVLTGIEVGVMVDNITVIMLLMVTMCSFLIHLFSTWYMWGEVRYSRFFGYLSLFTGSMLGLVISDNLLTLFVFWELMGFCSYALIGFYFERETAIRANLKAFMTTRVGDTALFIGMLVIWNSCGSLRFHDIYEAIGHGAFNSEMYGMTAAFLAGMLVLMGTIGKSAQFPLQVWLPDAMEGPTPVSALIHAATMVAAGVYLIIRMYPLLEAGDVLIVVAYVGAITAFLASLMAIIQTDIKAVLAYSTISQLGYMVLGVGVGAYAAAFMHLITHALFKACLFMSSGSVIHGIHTQDMREMGGLRRKMPFTCFAMIMATLAISGYPLTSGFVSKDKILAQALYFGGLKQSEHILLPILGFTAAAITAFYMFRMIFLTFFGKPRDQEKFDHAHKEQAKEVNRWLPLVWLASLSLAVVFTGSISGALESDRVFGKYNNWFENLVIPPGSQSLEGAVLPTAQQADGVLTSIEPNEALETDEAAIAAARIPLEVEEPVEIHDEDHHLHHVAHVWALGISIAVALLGTFFAALFYLWGKLDPNKVLNALRPIHTLLVNRYYFDYFYLEILIKKILLPLARRLGFVDMELYDKYMIDGWATVVKGGYVATQAVDDVVVDQVLVDGTGKSIYFFGSLIRKIQTGRVQQYLAVGLTVVMAIALIAYI